MQFWEHQDPRLCTGLLVLLAFVPSIGAMELNTSPFPCSDPDGTPVSLFEKTNGAIPDYPCLSCQCMNSSVNCTSETCDYSTCPVLGEKKSGSCCRECKKCAYAGGFYANDEHWQSTQDACRTLTCKGGVTTIARMQCVTPCRNPKRDIGYCCPLCPADSLENTLIDDPCIKCSCSVDKCHCYRTACPALVCKAQVVKEGSCCPECADEPLEAVGIERANKCFFKDEYYDHDTSFRPDDCTLCKCTEGAVLCRRFVCPVIDCPKQRKYWLPGLCCPRCRDKDPLPCSLHNGRTIKHGEEWLSGNKCTRCKCFNGELKCQQKHCQHPHTCPQGYKAKRVPDQCCQVCVEKDAMCSVSGNSYKSFDGRSFDFDGSCRYILSKQCTISRREIPRFEIISANSYNKDNATTSLRRITVRITYPDDTVLRITLLQKMRVKENGQQVRLPHVRLGEYSAHIDRSGSVLLRITQPPIKVVWDGANAASISVPTEYQTQLCGLCGNYNLDVGDDFQGADTVQELGDSWRHSSWRKCRNPLDRKRQRKLSAELRQERRKAKKEEKFFGWMQILSSNRGGISRDKQEEMKSLLESFFSSKKDTEENPVSSLFPVEKPKHKDRTGMLIAKFCPSDDLSAEKEKMIRAECGVLKSSVFRSCRSTVPLSKFYRWCIKDACACPSTGRCYCESLEAYAEKCERKNILIEWKSRTRCDNGKTCPIPGMSFSLCANQCARTCDNYSKLLSNVPCTKPCQPGCQCPPDQVLFGKKCISPSDCPLLR